jgi:hypothetical protein
MSAQCCLGSLPSFKNKTENFEDLASEAGVSFHGQQVQVMANTHK